MNGSRQNKEILRLRRVMVLSCLLLFLLLVWTAVVPAVVERCPIEAQQGDLRFPVGDISPSHRCQISAVIQDASTFGTIGPRPTPMAWPLYEYLLDHPEIAAPLVRQLAIAGYEISKQGQDVWWAKDGEGTQGLATLTYSDQTTRIYSMEGSHTGLMIGPVYTKAVVFLKAFPDERSLTVDTMLVVYTQLDERHWVLRSLLTIVRPLVEDTVTRIVGKAFTVADKLGAYIAEDPERVMQVASSLSSVDPEEVQRLLVLLRERSGTKSYTSFSPKSGNED